jgi:hypothetical protein
MSQSKLYGIGPELARGAEKPRFKAPPSALVIGEKKGKEKAPEIADYQKQMIAATEDTINFADALQWASDKNQAFFDSVKETEKLIAEWTMVQAKEDVIDFAEAIDYVNQKNIDMFEEMKPARKRIHVAGRWIDHVRRVHKQPHEHGEKYEDWSKRLQNIFLGTLDLHLMTTQMAINMAIFGSIKGAGGFAGGVFSILGIPSAQHGGITTRATPAFLHPNEAIIPLMSMGQDGDLYRKQHQRHCSKEFFDFVEPIRMQ